MKSKFIILIIMVFIISIIFDKDVLRLVSFFRNYYLTSFMKIVSSLIFVFLLLVVYSVLLKKKRDISLLWFSAIVSYAVSLILKGVFKVARPEGVINEIGYAFPSSHAMVIFSTIVVMNLRFKKVKWVFLLMAFLISFSRLYLGVHYLSDLLVGGILGYGIGWVLNRKWK